jgi:hypothetical protein
MRLAESCRVVGDSVSVVMNEGVAGMSVVKFLIPSMTTDDDVRWMDSGFYRCTTSRTGSAS